jgi:hypothetical protein
LTTSLSLEECRAVLKKKVKQNPDRLFKFRKTGFIGDFYNNEFWISKSFILSVSMLYLFLFLFMGFPFYIFDGLEGILHHPLYSISVILILNIIAYFMTLYQYHLALKLDREIFQCDESK